MQYDVDIGGRVRQVQVHREDGRFLVSVDGRESTIDAVQIDAHTLSLLVGLSSFEVTFALERATGQLTMGVGPVPLAVALNSRRRGGRKDDGGHDTGPERLVAPMPGKIIRILVGRGDPVSPRQPLVVIEAMKMENELRASRGGAVADVLVQEGQSVDVGTLLVVVEPA